MHNVRSLVAKQAMTICLALVAVGGGATLLAASSAKAIKYWQSGYQKEQAGDHQGAIAEYTKAIKADPTYTMAWSSRASERIKAGDYDGAIADATKCIELDSAETPCYGIRGSAYKAKGDTANADADFKTVTDRIKAIEAKNDEIRATAKHYTDGQAIPGVGTAIGDVYILPNGGCFGGKGAGIHWSSGATSYFGLTISASSPIILVPPGSPATK